MARLPKIDSIASLIRYRGKSGIYEMKVSQFTGPHKECLLTAFFLDGTIFSIPFASISVCRYFLQRPIFAGINVLWEVPLYTATWQDKGVYHHEIRRNDLSVAGNGPKNTGEIWIKTKEYVK